MAVCTNFVLINKILCSYGTMFLKHEDFLQKKARSGFTLSIRGCPTTRTIKLFAIESLRENRPHAVYKSTKLFDMERFHDTLVCNYRTLRNEKSSFLICPYG